ncbi:hypothetical protein INT80_09025 [Gallibacterium anatis]|uniref:Uncharacterized protein n=1 Tax=Gallibacterium anatis TaxID=750 RepID=A0A930UXV3_9PAST|nr:hypothetical protein [Gallibacterium anatis]
MEEKPFSTFWGYFQIVYEDIGDKLENKTFCVRVKRKGSTNSPLLDAERYIGGGLNQHIAST